MRRRLPIDPLPQISEINMTPLMDLTFILLITFIITFPLIEQGIPVNLPTGEAPELADQDSRTVSVDVDGKVYLDADEVSLERLTSDMNAIGSANSDITIYVRGDDKTAYGQVVKVIEVMHGAGISRVALVTQPGADKDDDQ
jgi:biopolymer transport protein TolR